MSIENLRGALPEYAKDQKLNLGSLTRSTELSEQQLWGTLLASAAATRNAKVIAEIAEEAKEHLSEEAVEAAYGAATVMAMNNVAYRAKGWLGDDYANVKFGLRMNIISKPGVEKADFELWSLAVFHHQRLRALRRGARQHRPRGRRDQGAGLGGRQGRWRCPGSGPGTDHRGRTLST